MQETVTAHSPTTSDEAAAVQRAAAEALGVPLVQELDLGEGVTLKAILIPAGKFMMGSLVAPDEHNLGLNELPQHEVAITKPFYMGVHEVTQEQWTAVMGSKPWEGMDNVKDGATHAASWISWYDAAEFCRTLTAETGKTVALPTEAQWEYACRAGSMTQFFYGDYDAPFTLGNYAWYETNAWNVGEKYAHAVGQKKPNAWGLYDMHGNVWEWCENWYADSYANAGRADPAGPASGNSRVLRGDSFYGNCLIRCCRSAVRSCHAPAGGWFGFGFRVVVAPGL